MSEEQIYFFIGGVSTALAAMILWIAVILPSPNKWNKRFIVTMFSIFALWAIFAVLDLLLYSDSEMVWAERIISYFGYLLPSLQLIIFTAYLLYICKENLWNSLLLRSVLILWLIYFILLGVAQFTTFLYYTTPDNEYVRGSWHILLMAPAIAILLLNLVGVIRRRDKLSKKYYIAFMVYQVPYTIVIILHAIIYMIVPVVLIMCVSMLAMLVIILYEQIEHYVGQQREIANQRANIMVLQMRPHFIYNAMMSIHYLCAQNPKKAQQVTLDFTTYLRKNFTAIANEDPIPFTDELEHTRAYLAVEQVQFEDSLCVEYDTPHKNFRLPPLTLQPIVENAVKHGMDPEKAPLHILIRTRETENGNELIVEDNGSGFDVSVLDKSESHTALTNIRQRLEMMCGGKITIRPREGGGTVVTVTIP